MKHFLISLFLIVFNTIISFGQNVDSCELKLQNELLYLSKGNSNENLSYDLSVLIKCGKLDSLDLRFLLTPQMIGGIISQNASTNNKITYSMILNELIKYSQSQEYKSLRDELLLTEPVNYSYAQRGIQNTISEFRGFTNMENALNEANREKKRLLLYFSGKSCVNARKMETKVLNNQINSRILREKYIPYLLYVDDEINGATYSDLQNKYDSNYQPLFVILDSSGKLVKKCGYTSDLDEFKLFLE